MTHVPGRNYDLQELDTCFTYHPPKDDQPRRYGLIRSEAKSFAAFLSSVCPSSRERDIAIQKLEEAIFWANAAIAWRENSLPQGTAENKEVR